MTKKRQSVTLVIVLLALCLLVFTACGKQNQVNFEDYVNGGSDNLNLIGRLVQTMHGWIGNYGWTVVVFTVALKIVMIPFDIWQRSSAKKNTAKMQQIQPLLDNIDKRYGANTQKANEEKQKIYKKTSVSAFSSCLPMLVTMGIFIFMFSGLNNYATYNNVMNYNELKTFYSQQLTQARADEQLEEQFYLSNPGATAEEFDDYCQKAAREGIEGTNYVGIANHYNNNVKESFLWIQSIWQPDTWDSVMPTYEKFITTVDLGSETNAELEYNLIRNEILSTGTRGDKGNWNGLMILPLLSVGLSFLSMFISQKQERKTKDGKEAPQNEQQAQSNKMMMFMMPAMMAFFGFSYTGAFAIYMVCNYTLSILLTVVLKKPIDKIVEKQLEKDALNDNSKVTYKR